MYMWIDGEIWAGDDCAPVTERHGLLVDPMTGMHYGRILTEDEEQVVRAALLLWRSQVGTLPLF